MSIAVSGAGALFVRGSLLHLARVGVSLAGKGAGDSVGKGWRKACGKPRDTPPLRGAPLPEGLFVHEDWQSRQGPDLVSGGCVCKSLRGFSIGP